MTEIAGGPTVASRGAVAPPTPGVDGATVELPPRCRAGGSGCVPGLVRVRVVQYPPAPPSASALSARQWRGVRRAVGVGVFVLLTAVGVDVGLQAAPASAVASSPGPVAPAPVSPAVPPPVPGPGASAPRPAHAAHAVPGPAVPGHRAPEHARALGPRVTPARIR